MKEKEGASMWCRQQQRQQRRQSDQVAGAGVRWFAALRSLLMSIGRMRLSVTPQGLYCNASTCFSRRGSKKRPERGEGQDMGRFEVWTRQRPKRRARKSGGGIEGPSQPEAVSMLK